jgi:restriction system protein
MSAQKKKAEFVKWMGPLLDALRELGGSGSPREASDLIAKNLGISDEKKEELMESGAPRFHNQVCWARQYLVWDGLIGAEKRGIWKLTEKGNNTKLNAEVSREIFLKWVDIHAKSRKIKSGKSAADEETEIVTGKAIEDEDVSLAHRKELMALLRSLSPEGFENLCKYILRVYGFQNVNVTPKGKDGGIDGYGILQLNPFVSFKVIFQCKRYQGTVSRAQVGDLRNAMFGRADKGIMITTGAFSEDARREADREGAPAVELIDGELLMDMLEKEEIGVKPQKSYRVDYEFFDPYLPQQA